MRTHGIPATYRAGCRCADCREASRRASAIRRERHYGKRALVHGRFVAPVPDEMHGRRHTYLMHGCRCARCTAAHSEACRERRAAS